MSYADIEIDRIQQALDDGKITEREADELMDDVMARANAAVDASRN